MGWHQIFDVEESIGEYAVSARARQQAVRRKRNAAYYAGRRHEQFREAIRIQSHNLRNSVADIRTDDRAKHEIASSGTLADAILALSHGRNDEASAIANSVAQAAAGSHAVSDQKTLLLARRILRRAGLPVSVAALGNPKRRAELLIELEKQTILSIDAANAIEDQITWCADTLELSNLYRLQGRRQKCTDAIAAASYRASSEFKRNPGDEVWMLMKFYVSAWSAQIYAEFDPEDDASEAAWLEVIKYSLLTQRTRREYLLQDVSRQRLNLTLDKNAEYYLNRLNALEEGIQMTPWEAYRGGRVRSTLLHQLGDRTKSHDELLTAYGGLVLFSRYHFEDLVRTARRRGWNEKLPDLPKSGDTRMGSLISAFDQESVFVPYFAHSGAPILPISMAIMPSKTSVVKV